MIFLRRCSLLFGYGIVSLLQESGAADPENVTSELVQTYTLNNFEVLKYMQILIFSTSSYCDSLHHLILTNKLRGDGPHICQNNLLLIVRLSGSTFPLELGMLPFNVMFKRNQRIHSYLARICTLCTKVVKKMTLPGR